MTPISSGIRSKPIKLFLFSKLFQISKNGTVSFVIFDPSHNLNWKKVETLIDSKFSSVRVTRIEFNRVIQL